MVSPSVARWLDLAGSVRAASVPSRRAAPVNGELVAETRKEKPGAWPRQPARCAATPRPASKDERSFGFRAIVAVNEVSQFHGTVVDETKA
jgi:hypothetical protein